MSPIHFFFDNVTVSLKDRTRLKNYIQKLIRSEGGKLISVNYVFCNSRQLLRINQQYLGHDDHTDIITFNLSPDPKQIEGEIYISIDRVRENARKYQTSFKNELLRVIFHGALHLCGYGDKTRGEQKEMRLAEDLWINKYK